MPLAIKMPIELDATMMTQLKPQFEDLANSRENVTLDLSQVENLDSSGIGGIVFLYKRLVAAGYQLSVTGAHDQPLHLLTALQLNDILKSK